MRITMKSTFWLATIYVTLTVVLAAWMEMEKRAATRSLMAGTAELIGREVSGALQDMSLEQLVIDDRAVRQRLRAAINTTSRQSSVVSDLSVIDRDGRVVESDDSALVGPLGENFSSLLDVGTYRLVTPLFKNDTLIGYIQMKVNIYDIRMLNLNL